MPAKGRIHALAVCPLDDLIGIQNPQARLTDPASAVAALGRAAPGLTRLRRTALAGIHWVEAEESLGTAFPRTTNARRDLSVAGLR